MSSSPSTGADELAVAPLPLAWLLVARFSFGRAATPVATLLVAFSAAFDSSRSRESPFWRESDFGPSILRLADGCYTLFVNYTGSCLVLRVHWRSDLLTRQSGAGGMALV